VVDDERVRSIEEANMALLLEKFEENGWVG
jgi:hypothetical protein